MAAVSAIIVIAVMIAGVAYVFVRSYRQSLITPDLQTSSGNPWRVGNTVLICEDITRPEMNWYGTVLSTNRHMLTVRDMSAPYAVVDLEKEYAYHRDAQL